MVKQEKSVAIDVHINLDEGQRIVVPVNRQVLARNMKLFGFEPGQPKWEREARIVRIQGDCLAVWVSVKEAFPKFSDLVKYVSR